MLDVGGVLQRSLHISVRVTSLHSMGCGFAEGNTGSGALDDEKKELAAGQRSSYPEKPLSLPFGFSTSTQSGP